MNLRGIAFMACAALVLAGLWLFLKPPAPPPDQGGAEPLRVQYRVEGMQITGPEKIMVRQGYPVEILVQADLVDTLHLHGYELTDGVTPGNPASLSLTANLAGRFVLELHQSERQLGTLEVQPFSN